MSDPGALTDSLRDSERRSLIEGQLQNGLFLDRWLLTISAGVFGLSVAFIRDIVGPGPVVSKRLLAISWACFAACIIMTLTSSLLAYPAYSRQMELLDDPDAPDVNRWRGAMYGLTITAVGFFAVAVVSLAMFALRNM